MAHTAEGRTDAVRLHHQCHIDSPLEELERHPALLGRRRQELWIGVRSEPPEGTSEDQSFPLEGLTPPASDRIALARRPPWVDQIPGELNVRRAEVVSDHGRQEFRYEPALDGK